MKNYEAINERVSRLRWACQRTKPELDAPLKLFLEQEYVDLSMGQRFAFERLLTTNDKDISDWLNNHSSPKDAGLEEIISMLQEMMDQSPEQENNPPE